MRVLDLFVVEVAQPSDCNQAWPDAEIVGVDHKPMPRYPFEFVEADAMNAQESLFRGGGGYHEEGRTGSSRG